MVIQSQRIIQKIVKRGDYMAKEYSKVLGELVSISCPKCSSEDYKFSKPVVSKGSIILPCTCSKCNQYFTTAYKAYEIEYVGGNGKVTIGLR